MWLKSNQLLLGILQIQGTNPVLDILIDIYIPV